MNLNPNGKSRLKRILRSMLVAAAVAQIPMRGAQAATFEWMNLVSDIHGVAHVQDGNLINPWGIAIAPTGGIWVANNNSGVSTVYATDGTPLPAGDPLVVMIPTVSGIGTSSPDGMVLNRASLLATGTDSFVITGTNGKSGPSEFIFSTEDGVVAAWSPSVDPVNAVIPPAFSGTTTAVYKGLALSVTSAGAQQLYVANLRAGTVEVYDKTFTRVATSGFVDPNAASGFHPFNIKNVAFKDSKTHSVVRYLLVSYALPDNSGHDDVGGDGNGYINAFDPGGNFKGQIVANGTELNSPWGMAIAHHPTRDSVGTLLVGNFGRSPTTDTAAQQTGGQIHAYALAIDPTNGNLAGTPLGALETKAGTKLNFDELWGLSFGLLHPSVKTLADDPDELIENETKLYFTAGIVFESDGIFGVIFPK